MTPRSFAQFDRHDWFNWALGQLPKPQPRGTNTCAWCVQPIGSEPFLCGIGARFGPREGQIVPLPDREILTWHTPCHAVWWADRVAQARALIELQKEKAA